MNFIRKAFGAVGPQQKNQIPPSLEDNQAISSRSSAQNSPSLIFPAGVEVWHDCPQATVDICFVHGLEGHRSNTWTANGQSTPWPKTLLSRHLPRARILAYGYDADIVRRSVASQNGLRDHALNLVNDLTSERTLRNASSRPIIFVAHSLGGLICQSAILQSQNPPELHLGSIFRCTKGVVFMGTPHKGSWMTVLGLPAAATLGLVKSTSKRSLEILRKDNQSLKDIQVDFQSMMRRSREDGRRLEATCFYEELPLPAVGLVVSKDSATVDGYNNLSIHANHIDMVKFSSEDDTGFKRVLAVLLRWEKDVCSPPVQMGAKRHYDGSDWGTLLKRRRTRSVSDDEESDDSAGSEYEGGSVFNEIDCTEDDSTEQPTQDSLEKNSSSDEGDTTDEDTGASQDTGAYDEDDTTDDFPQSLRNIMYPEEGGDDETEYDSPPFSQNTLYSEEEEDDETEYDFP